MHEAYDEDKLDKVMALAKAGNPKVYALIQLLYKGALRIQDVIGLKFSDVT